MILLDTHALVWWQEDPSPLPERVVRRIEESGRTYVSTVTCWEVATLVARGRVHLDRTLGEWLADMRAEESIVITPLGAEAAIRTADLDATGFHRDPADRLLYATALGLDVTFLTRDSRMHDYSAHAPRRLRVECAWDEP
ncbi:MAG: type II toxin-antitoxin system VapC family toxin [Actinobacteria bacterium ATB1]|nr:type II toxin-antitoxin system VapC family toxin [Actinobacteria bacterium ATB1]